MDPFTHIASQLIDALNAVGDSDIDYDGDKRLNEYADRLELAIAAALQIANDASEYVNTGHEQAALDHYWEQKIDETRGK